LCVRVLPLLHLHSRLPSTRLASLFGIRHPQHSTPPLLSAALGIQICTLCCTQKQTIAAIRALESRGHAPAPPPAEARAHARSADEITHGTIARI
jgi:hypothetical protein